MMLYTVSNIDAISLHFYSDAMSPTFIFRIEVFFYGFPFISLCKSCNITGGPLAAIFLGIS